MPETPQYLELSGALSVSRHCLTISARRTEEGWNWGGGGWGLGSARLFPSLGVIEDPGTKTHTLRMTICPSAGQATEVVLPFLLPTQKGCLIRAKPQGSWLSSHLEYPAEIPTIPTPMFLMRLLGEFLIRWVLVSCCILAGEVCGSSHDTLSTSCDYQPHWHGLPLLSANLFVNRYYKTPLLLTRASCQLDEWQQTTNVP